MTRIKSSSRKIDTVFVVMLFTIFAVLALLVVLITTKQFKHTASVMEEDYQVRTANSYLREIVRQHDKSTVVNISDFSGNSAITFTESINGYTIITYVYCYDGYIRELSSVDSAEVAPDSGAPVIQAQALNAEMLTDDTLKISYEDEFGDAHQLYIALHASGKEVL